MAAYVTIRFNLVPQMPLKLRVGAAQALNAGIMRAVGYADPLTPVDTGALRANKHVEVASPDSLSASVAWQQHYGIYQEMGTRRGIQPKWFARTGMERATPGVIDDMRLIGATLGR